MIGLIARGKKRFSVEDRLTAGTGQEIFRKVSPKEDEKGRQKFVQGIWRWVYAYFKK